MRRCCDCKRMMFLYPEYRLACDSCAAKQLSRLEAANAKATADKIRELELYGDHATATINCRVISIDRDRETVTLDIGDDRIEVWIHCVEAHPIIGG